MYIRHINLAAIVLVVQAIGFSSAFSAPATGPLRVHPQNSRYFTDGSDKAVYLTGSHTWNNLMDMGESDPPPKFDYAAYLDFMERHNHNFMRMWTWELATWNTQANNQKKLHHVAPLVYARTGPGNALDGKPKFDLNKFDPEYFDRLRSRVAAARDRGIYVSIMLFEGWGVQRIAGGWKGHPYNRDNNLNGIDGDKDGDGNGLEIHELAIPAVTALQEACVRKVIDTVNDLDNVLYEISNENHPLSTEWQYHIIAYIHKYEKTKPKQHPVGMTFQFKGGQNSALFDSPAEWVSPNPEGGFRDNPPAWDGRKIVLNDTDHLWGTGGNSPWVWKSFLRGLNPILMDPYDGRVLEGKPESKWDPIRRSMGYTLRFAKRMNLAAMVPHNEIASTSYCLANPGNEYLVYLPTSGTITVDLSAASGALAAEWFDPNKDATIDGGTIEGGARRSFKSPFGRDAVLYLKAKEASRRQ
jgi:hypothetical protein